MLKLWRQMCCAPKKTISKVLNKGQDRNFLILATIYGLPIVFHLIQEFSLGSGLPLGLIWILGILFALPIGVLGIYIFGIVLYWAGKLVHGKAKPKQLRIAFAWSNVPVALTVIGWIGLTFVFGSSLFLHSFAFQDYTFCQTAALFVFAAIQFTAMIWSIVLLLKSLTVVQKFPMSSAIINVVVPFLIFLAWMAIIR